MKIEVNPFKKNNISKNRNQKSKSLIFTDTAGNPIKGDTQLHYQKIGAKIQERYNNTISKLSNFTEEEFIVALENPKSVDFIKSSTDREALKDAYWKKCFEFAKELSVEEVESQYKELKAGTYSEKLKKDAFEKAYELSKLKPSKDV